MKNLNCLFYNCRSLTSLKLPNFETPETINSMFFNCRNLSSIDLSKINTLLMLFFNIKENLQGNFKFLSTLCSYVFKFLKRFLVLKNSFG